MTIMEKCRSSMQIRNRLIVNCLSELYGTCLLLFIGICIVFQYDLGHKKMNTWINVNIGWGFTITFCVYAVSKTSGGHLNPAISLLMYTMGKIPFTWLILYCIAQVIGAFVGTVCAYCLYYDQIWHVIGAQRIANLTGAMFTSMPAAHVSNATAFFDQFVGTGFLALFALVVIEKRNEIPEHLHGLMFGLFVTMIGCAFGMNLGYPINPARDLGPRIFAALVGYGWEMFSHHNYYFWIPIVAPCFGTVFAGWSYYLFVGFHIPDKEPMISYGKNIGENAPLKNRFNT